MADTWPQTYIPHKTAFLAFEDWSSKPLSQAQKARWVNDKLYTIKTFFEFV